MRNVFILILCCIVEKRIVWGFWGLLNLFYKQNLPGWCLANSNIGSAGAALCCVTLLWHDMSCLCCAASRVAERHGRWQEVDLSFATPLHSNERTSSCTGSFPCIHRETTAVTFSRRWCCALMLLTEWNRHCSADRRCSAPGSRRGRAGVSAVSLKMDKATLLLRDRVDRNHADLPVWSHKRFWDWTQTPRHWVIAHKQRWWLRGWDSMLSYATVLLHVAEN